MEITEIFYRGTLLLFYGKFIADAVLVKISAKLLENRSTFDLYS